MRVGWIALCGRSLEDVVVIYGYVNKDSSTKRFPEVKNRDVEVMATENARMYLELRVCVHAGTHSFIRIVLLYY